MNLKSLGIIIIIHISVLHLSFSQDQHLIDSLTHCLKTVKHDTVKVNILYELSAAYWGNNPDKAMEYAGQILALSDKTEYKKGIAFAYQSMGNVERTKGNYLQALEYYKKVKEIKSEARDERGIASISYNIGVIFTLLGNYPEALKYLLSALKSQEKTGNKKGMAGSYSTIGVIYTYQANFPEALKNLHAALKIYEELGLRQDVAQVYSNIGGLYLNQHKYPDALKSFFTALKILEESGDQINIAETYSNIGAVYHKQEKFDEALKFFFDALKINTDIGNKFGIANSTGEIGEIYAKQKKYNEAAQYLNRALSLSKEIGHLENIKWDYLALSDLGVVQGNYKQAFENYKHYITYRDSLVNDENTKKITQEQMQYEFDKKESLTKAEQEKKDAVAQQELQKQKLVRNGFIGGFVIVLLFAGVFFKQRNKIKKGNVALQIAKERAEQSEQFKQQFLANMSHEIRTPMNAVMGMTSLVLETPLQDKQKFYMEGIKKSSDTLLHIINDILDLSKIEAGKMELEKIDFSLSDTLKQVWQTLSHRAEEKGLELLVKIDPGMDDVVIGDPVRLNQVLINLAGNAIKFTEKGSVCIEVTKTDIESALQFAIIDTGIGIPQEKLQTVFDNFSQANTSDTRKYGGTGLGLSISRQLVDLMGGKISISSTEGTGTTFSFRVICEKGSSEKLEQRLASEEQVDGSILDGLSILVVDDNEYNRIVAKDTLESKAKVKVVAVASSAEAIELLKSTDFDVVLMDVQMPVMNGFEATRQIRSGKYEVGSTKDEVQNHDIPIIALTASVLRTDLEKCTAAGMNGYIPKPFKASQLIIGIAQVLNVALKVKKKNESGNIEPGTLTGSVTDLEYLDKFCEGDKERMKKYIEMFLASAPTFLEKINIALINNDFLEIADQMHGYKTRFLMMGMKEAKTLAAEIEMNCRQEYNSVSVNETLQKVINQVEIAVKELKSA
jgi:signal transduction histidine kinase/CheY-like chemotaxis protein/HPt (histidine-containing phosphotransfer) domain-containing protein/Tfp pilus assembly protein PilF